MLGFHVSRSVACQAPGLHCVHLGGIVLVLYVLLILIGLRKNISRYISITIIFVAFYLDDLVWAVTWRLIVVCVLVSLGLVRSVENSAIVCHHDGLGLTELTCILL